MKIRGTLLLLLVLFSGCIQITERVREESNEMEEQIFFGVVNSDTKKVEKKTLKLTASQLVLDSIEIELKDIDMVCTNTAGMPCDIKEF